MKSKAQLWIQVFIIIVLIGIISFQIYTNYQTKNEIGLMNTDLTAHEALLTNIGSDLSNLKTTTDSKFDVLDSQLNVVNQQLEISTTQITDLQQDVSNIQIQSQDFASIIDEILPSIVSVIAGRSQGSGVIISDDGYIVTNHHVIEDSSKIRVLTFDNEIYNAEVVGISQQADIALLKIDENNLDLLDFGDSDDVRVGEHVIALGNPAGLSFSVTEGIISATERIGPNGLKAYIQTDVPINPGNSGGPLVNIEKEIIGINNFKIGGFESLGFAIDSNHVEEVIDEIFEELARLEAEA